MGGTLTIAAANTLGLAGTIVNNGGTLVATNTSSVINFNSTVSGQQVPGGNYFNIQFNGASKVLTGAVNVTGSANILINLLVYLGNYNLVIGPTGSVSANGSRYFVTNGTGGMKKMGITSTSFVYPLGSGTSYTPFLVNNAGGVSDNFTGRVIDSVYSTYVNDVPQGSPILTNVVNKTWFVTEDVPGGSNVQMIVQWNQADERPGFVRTSCTLSHYRGGGWIAMPLVTSSPATGAGPYTQTRTGITSFSPFGVGGAGSALPVKLESFNGYASSAGNQLTWKTSFEQNLDRFVIERSTDGINFTDIGSVKAGTGNTGTYSFLDTRPDGSSKQYYRLRIVDLDNSREYSAVVTILPAKQNAGSWSVSPNPVTGNEVVLRPGATAPAIQQISIVDIAGKTWRNTSGNGAGQPSIDVKALPAGSYVLKLQTAAGVQTLKLQRL
ncbi:MAG: T9SS type A sorting domain-containing protein [Cytophagaceae bacterium]|nr:MAG: T9SS type A sorting domain-containing protein [Cytophagaceae bacterium]